MTDTPLFKNNAVGYLAGAINSTQTTIALASGDGAKFPNPTMYEYFVITVRGLTGNEREIMHCIGRTGDELSVMRGQESTTPLAFAAGDEVSMQITAGILEYLRDL